MTRPTHAGYSRRIVDSDLRVELVAEGIYSHIDRVRSENTDLTFEEVAIALTGVLDRYLRDMRRQSPRGVGRLILDAH